MRATRITVVILGLSACGLHVEDGVFACDETRHCPPGLECAGDGRCYRDPPPFDASRPPMDSGSDAQSMDSGSDVDSGPRDATSDPPPPAVCGDGIVEPGEGCDDGNTDDGDGCNAECQLECDGAAVFDESLFDESCFAP